MKAFNDWLVSLLSKEGAAVGTAILVDDSVGGDVAVGFGWRPAAISCMPVMINTRAAGQRSWAGICLGQFSQSVSVGDLQHGTLH